MSCNLHHSDLCLLRMSQHLRGCVNAPYVQLMLCPALHETIASVQEHCEAVRLMLEVASVTDALDLARRYQQEHLATPGALAALVDAFVRWGKESKRLDEIIIAPWTHQVLCRSWRRCLRRCDSS